MSMQTTMRSAYIALGSNLGDREHNLKRALDLLAAADGCSVAAVGPLIGYTAEGSRPGAPDYLNSVAELRTELNPFALQATLQRIEKEMGRASQKDRQLNQDRMIDLDLLLYGKAIIATPALVVPHPRMHRRRFVLEPLDAIARDVLHPALGLTVRQLLEKLGTKDPT